MRNTISSRLLVAASATAILVPSTVDAEAADVGRLACTGYGEQEEEITRAQLAEAILVAAGQLPSRVDAAITAADGSAKRPDHDLALQIAAFGDAAFLDESKKQAWVWKATAPVKTAVRSQRESLYGAIRESSQVTQADLLLRIEPRPPVKDNMPGAWFLANVKQLRVYCKGPKQPETTDKEPKPSPLSRLGIGLTVDDLAATGQARRLAKSAQIGLVRSRERDDAGNRSTTTQWTIDGTLGVRLTRLNSPAPAYLYANYTLDRSRRRPTPVLADGKRERDGDTDALEIGGQLANQKLWPPRPKRGEASAPFALLLTGELGYIVDFVSDAERLRGRATLDVGFTSLDVGLCKFGGYKPMAPFGIRLRTRCRVAVVAELSEVLRRGTSDLGGDDSFLQAGPTFSFDIAPAFGAKQGIHAEVRGRYLPTISGGAPDIERLDASIKYRWWVSGNSALDFGLVWKYGTEPKSLVDENQLSLVFGVLF